MVVVTTEVKIYNKLLQKGHRRVVNVTPSTHASIDGRDRRWTQQQQQIRHQSTHPSSSQQHHRRRRGNLDASTHKEECG